MAEMTISNWSRKENINPRRAMFARKRAGIAGRKDGNNIYLTDKEWQAVKLEMRNGGK